MRCGVPGDAGDRRIVALDLLDDAADQFVDEQEPDLVGAGHAKVGTSSQAAALFLARMTLPPLLAELAREPQRAAILLDIDGVLAPIVSDPDAASVPERPAAKRAASSAATRSSAFSPAARRSRPAGS